MSSFPAGADRPDRPAGGRVSRRWWVPAVCGLVAGAVLVTVLSWERTTVVQTVRQPASVSYPDGSEHYVVVERHESIGAPVIGGTRHELWLGRDPGLDYGHSVALGFTGADVERFDARWTERGVEVRFASGHTIFVPAGSFTGGR